MAPERNSDQRQRLETEGLSLDAKGKVQNADKHFHILGLRRNIRWDGQSGS